MQFCDTAQPAKPQPNPKRTLHRTEAMDAEALLWSFDFAHFHLFEFVSDFGFPAPPARVRHWLFPVHQPSTINSFEAPLLWVHHQWLEFVLVDVIREFGPLVAALSRWVLSALAFQLSGLIPHPFPRSPSVSSVCSCKIRVHPCLSAVKALVPAFLSACIFA
jgi:hypothetical protein